LRVYGIDPHRATLRRVVTLVQRLPAGTWHKDQGPGSWSNEAYLLAAVVDAVNQHAWMTAAINSKRKPPKPEPVQRPGGKKKAKKKIAWTDLHKQFGVGDG
jgi:hypothetical protein